MVDWPVMRALLTLAVAFAVGALAVSAQALSSSVRPSAVAARKKPASLVTFTGSAGTRSTGKVRVSPKAQVISPSVVRSIPDPGKPSALTYAGGNDTTPGQIVVIGQGNDTLDGFIGRVTDVEHTGGQTVAATVPATLLQAAPDGSMDLVAKTVTAASSAGRRC